MRAALDRIRTEVARIVSLAIEDETWDFAFAERGFGNAGDEWPALVIERGALTPHAARTNRSRRSSHTTNPPSRAIDYKRRVSLPAIVDLGVTAIQIPLYAIVAQRALGVARRSRSLPLDGEPRAFGDAAFDARFAELVARTSQTARRKRRRFAIDSVLALRDGDIGPQPSAPKWCAQCGLDAACRRPRFAVTMIGREESDE